MDANGERRHWVRWLVGLTAPVVLVTLLARHWSTFDVGTDAMGRGDREWLITAGVAVVLTWAAATCCQLGATLATVPVGRVFATQVAGSFVNHVLPAGVGIATLNLRMLRRSGLSRPGAAGAVGLNTAAGFITHAIALAAFLLLAGPHAVDRTYLVPVAGGILVALALSAWGIRRARSGTGRLAERITGTAAAAGAVLRHPGRAAMLWLGSAAIPALHILILTAVLHALHRPAPVLVLSAVYLGASAVAAAIPGPGGFGALDVTLLAALTGTGLSTVAAATAVIGYRVLTVWLPLIPGALTLMVLLHRRII